MLDITLLIMPALQDRQWVAIWTRRPRSCTSLSAFARSSYSQGWSTSANTRGAKVAWNAATTSGWEAAAIASLAMFIAAVAVPVALWFLTKRPSFGDPALSKLIRTSLTFCVVADICADSTTTIQAGSISDVH